jgi:thiamine biosynthesis lipoprotein
MALSQWEPRSALSALNRAPVGEWIAIAPDLARVIDAGLAIAAASDGAFDIAGGALADLWGFGPPGPRSTIPRDDEIADARAHSGGGIERDGDRARRTGDVALDLSGIGKGHAVDALAAALSEHGVRDFLVEIGGEFVGCGIRPDAQPWWVELENPPGIDLPPLRIATHGIAVATSGDYRRFVRDGARRLGHTIDPRTGRPVDNGVVSVSVIAADCMTADGWATALTVAGPELGMTLAARERLAARIVTGDGREYLSLALQAMLG